MRLTGGFAANMTKESSNLHHLQGLVASGTKTQWLIKCCSGDEGVIVPETNSMSHWRITLCKQILKLVSLKVICDCQITTVNRPSLTLPPFVTQFLPLRILHKGLRRIIPIH